MTGIAFPAPDAEIMGRREQIIAGLARLVAPEALITTEDERRAFETDALTAYRRMPLAVVLPASTEEVAAVLSFCNEKACKVVPRGAGTSLAGGAHTAGGRDRAWRRQDEQGAGRQFRRPHHPRAGGHHQPRRSAGAVRTRASSTRPIRRRSWPAQSPATSR